MLHKTDRDVAVRAKTRRAPDAPLTGQPTLLTARELRRIVAEMLG